MDRDRCGCDLGPLIPSVVPRTTTTTTTTTIKEDATSACSPWKELQKVVKWTLVLSTICEQDAGWCGEPFCMQHPTHRAFCRARSTNKNNTPSRNPTIMRVGHFEKPMSLFLRRLVQQLLLQYFWFLIDEECSYHLSIVSPDTISKNPSSCLWKLFLALGMERRISATKMMCLLNLWFFVGDPMQPKRLSVLHDESSGDHFLTRH